MLRCLHLRGTGLRIGNLLWLGQSDICTLNRTQGTGYLASRCNITHDLHLKIMLNSAFSHTRRQKVPKAQLRVLGRKSSFFCTLSLDCTRTISVKNSRRRSSCCAAPRFRMHIRSSCPFLHGTPTWLSRLSCLHIL